MEKPEATKAGATQHEIPETAVPKQSGGQLLRKIVQKMRLEFDGFKAEAARSLGDLAQAIQRAQARVTTIGQQVANLFPLLGDMETRHEMVKALLIRKGITTEAEYEAVWDEIKGLRTKAAGEVVTAGDFVYLSFTSKLEDGTVVGQEKGFPMRVGSGQLIFEEKLLGRTVGPERFSFDYTYPKDFPMNPSLAGKTVTCDAVIDKVKVRIEEASKEEAANG